MESALLPEWFQYLEYEKRVSPGTLAVYKTALRCFATFLGTGEYGTAPKEVVPTIRSWIRWVTIFRGKNGGKADTSTLRTYLGALSSYYEWEVFEGRREKNPVPRVHRFKDDADTRQLISAEQIRGLFNACDLVGWPWNRELARAALALMCGTALRVAEARTLTLGDVDLNTRRLQVRDQKNNRRDTLPISSPFDVIFAEWLCQREEIFKRAKRRRARGRPRTDRFLCFSPDWPIGEEGIYKLFHQLVLISGQALDGVYPHALRHFAINAFYEAGGLEDARILARHSTQKTTAGYVHATNERLRQVSTAPGRLLFQQDQRTGLWGAPPATSTAAELLQELQQKREQLTLKF